MPNHSCVCSDALDRCDRCDVLLDFPRLHLVAVTQAPSGLVLEVESCDPVAGCPGCGVNATGHGSVMVEMIDAPWAGRPVRIRWRKLRWICPEGVCAVVSFVEQDPEVCAPRGPGISWRWPCRYRGCSVRRRGGVVHRWKLLVLSQDDRPRDHRGGVACGRRRARGGEGERPQGRRRVILRARDARTWGSRPAGRCLPR